MAQSGGLLRAVLEDTLHPSLVLFSIVSIIFVLLWPRRLNISAMRKIPSPLHLKLSTADVKYHEFVGTKSRWIHNLHLRYGPVIQIGRNEVSFASYTSSKQIYSNGNKDFRKTELYHLFEQDGHIIVKFADRYSNTTVLRSKVLESITERASAFARVCSGTGSADVYLYLHAYALDCVTAMLFHPYGTDSLVGDKDKEMNIEKGGTMIRDFVRECMAKDGLSDFTLATRLLSLDNTDMNLAEAECLDHIGAGIETTGDTLCWLMWELSQPKHWDKVTRLHNELLNADPNKGLETLPSLGAIVQEALRLWAPGTLPLPRYVSQGGRHIDSYFLPADTIVGCTAYSMHRLDTIIFPDADEFVPERWLDSAGNTDRQRLFFAFGLGARTCIGKHLAIAEMRACLNAVYSQYRTRPAHGMRSSMGPEDVVLTSRPIGMCCKVEFVPWDGVFKVPREGSPSEHV
ncbi:hypothetical protein CEP54_008978 [Fusarium duplospermum]|uniref:Cytochrome P450 n=1 Tax=Fusarium duplospermum TaxID=1325734 RepID=A0A428PT81_9HYPO|nr:hypothetical protein CEP54_008978 [Fusarium duplospermum]